MDLIGIPIRITVGKKITENQVELKLRKDDKTERVYKVPGGEGFIKAFAIVPFVLLILGVVFTLFGDFSMEYINENMPLIIGVVVSFVIEEILVARIKNN